MIVSAAFYSDTYYGEPIAQADYAKYESRAQDMILRLVNRTEAEVNAMSEAMQDAVKRAICAQMEYLSEYGMTVGTFGKTAGGFTVGKVSVQAGTTAASEAGARSMICPAVWAYLERTGLINPAVDTAPEPWLEGWWL